MKEMISTREQSELTGIAVSTLNSMRRRGLLPWDIFQVTPYKSVARRKDVLAWLESKRVKAEEVE